MLTYGDGVADIDFNGLLSFHESHGKTTTVTVVQPEGRYGSVDSTKDGRIEKFIEKPKGDRTWVSGGFFVCEPRIFDYLDEGDNTVFERKPLEDLARDGELFSYRHPGFWKCMDTLRDKINLTNMWDEKTPPDV